MSDLFTPPPSGQPPRRPGLRRERATDTRDASHRSYRRAKQSPVPGLTRDALNVLLNCVRYGPVTDRITAERIAAAKGTDFPPGRCSARRLELVDFPAGPLVERAHQVKDRKTGKTVWAWRATEAGRRLLQTLSQRSR